MYRGKHKSSLELKDAFLEDVIKGIGMVYQTKRALSIDSIQVTVRCDNSSVVAWLNRKEARHWRAARGTSAAAVEGKLQTLTDSAMLIWMFWDSDCDRVCTMDNEIK